MFEFIHNLHGKSESARRRFAFGVSLVVTLLIIGVWLTTIPSRTSPERRARVEETDVTPLRSLAGSFMELFSGIPEQLKNSTGTVTQPTPATSTEQGYADTIEATATDGAASTTESVSGSTTPEEATTTAESATD
jgi:hypothetical protein